MAKSDNLRKAKEQKNDEFYTRLEDIEAEISQHPDYVRQFYGKTVFCNCDDPEWSNFFVFFKLHFNQLKLKKLITTHYNPDGSPSYKIEWAGEMLNDDMVNLIKTPLKGNGDFRSEECIEILKEADIVVTNPPFSLYREYVAQLMEYNKEYVIIGNKNSIAYKEVFPLLKDGKMIVGYNAGHGTMHFATKVIDDNHIGPVTHSVPSYWFTNLDLDKSHEPLILTKNYYGNEDRYPKYDNYDAIECGKVKDIPKDYLPCWYNCPHASKCQYAKSEGKDTDRALCEMARNGEIGVPITYLANHCEDQFEILGSDNDFAKKMSEVDPNGKYTKGGPAFYLSENDDRTERERERESTLVQTPLQQTHHSQDSVSVTESSVSQSLYSQDYARNNSPYSELPIDKEVQDCEGTNTQRRIVQSTTTSTQEALSGRKTAHSRQPMQEFSFADCQKCNGVIGVPITYLATHSSNQFSILESCDRGYSPWKTRVYSQEDAKNWSDINRGASLSINGSLRNMYHRILIQRKPE